MLFFFSCSSLCLSFLKKATETIHSLSALIPPPPLAAWQAMVPQVVSSFSTILYSTILCSTTILYYYTSVAGDAVAGLELWVGWVSPPVLVGSSRTSGWVWTGCASATLLNKAVVCAEGTGGFGRGADAAVGR